MNNSNQYIDRMNLSLIRFFREALRISFRNPGIAWFLLKTIKRQKRAAIVRQIWESRGLHVPPYMIASVTKSCNLRCKGCYAQVHQHNTGAELATERWREIFSPSSTVDRQKSPISKITMLI